MAFKFMENFYQYAQAGTTLAAANSNFNTQWITHGSGGITITEGFDQDSRALTLSRTNSAFGQVERRFETEDDTIIVGWAFRSTARGASTFRMSSASRENFLELAWPREFSINGTEGNATILLNKRYFVEIKLQKSTGDVTVKVNGYDYLTVNVGAVTEDIIQCFWGWPASGEAADYVMSYVYFVDGSEGKYTNFLGPHRVTSRLSTSTQGTGWKPEPEDANPVNIMNNIPPVAGQYTESDTVGDKDFYKSDVVIDPDTEINAIAVTSLLTKTDIDDQFVALAISDGEVEKQGPDIEIPIQPAYHQSVFETDVDDEAWVPEAVEATAYGPIILPRP